MAQRYANVLITGASSGLGEGLARWFQTRGSKVYAAARRTERLEALAQAANGPGAIVPITLDVSDPAKVVETLGRVDRECGGLDLVIANAGVGATTYGKRLNWADFNQMLQVNVVGAAATLSALVPAMVERKRGHLVAVSSLAAFICPPATWGYSATKLFLHVVCRGLRMDLEGTGVKVTCIHPGYVKSEMTAKHTYKMPFLLETEDAVERMGQGIVREAEEYDFPSPMAVLAKVGGLLPAGIQKRVLKR
jgi:NADP-dependent 3-hydroxy acid dehydrogenase YdfG